MNQYGIGKNRPSDWQKSIGVQKQSSYMDNEYMVKRTFEFCGERVSLHKWLASLFAIERK